jgi:hypothetical protein
MTGVIHWDQSPISGVIFATGGKLLLTNTPKFLRHKPPSQHLYRRGNMTTKHVCFNGWFAWYSFQTMNNWLGHSRRYFTGRLDRTTEDTFPAGSWCPNVVLDYQRKTLTPCKVQGLWYTGTIHKWYSTYTCPLGTRR